MDILIHPFPSNEEDLYQRLAPLLNAVTTDSSQDSINAVPASKPSKSKKSSTEKSRQGSTAEQSSSSKAEQESAPVTIQASPAQTELGKKNDVKGKSPVQTLNNSQSTKDTLKSTTNTVKSTKDTIKSTTDTLKKRIIKNQIKIRLPDGTVVFSEFKKNDTLSSVKDWILTETRFARVKLSRSIPLKAFDDSDYSKPLEELKVFGHTLVAETEGEEPGLLSRILSFLLLIFKKIYDTFFGVPSEPQEETARASRRVYNGNSTSLE
jgi:hypothetical protein